MKLRPFEITLMFTFGILFFVALFIIRDASPPEPDDGLPVIGSVEIWGTLPATEINSLLGDLQFEQDRYNGVSYREISTNQFIDILVNALADGAGPDVVLYSHEQLTELQRRIQPLSYESFSVRDIRNLYLDGAQIFALDNGLYGYPILVDPLVMYWNRDILATEGSLAPPATWEELVNSALDELVVRRADGSIERAVVAMGEYQNTRNSFATLSSLLLQSGTAGVRFNSTTGYEVLLNRSVGSRDVSPLSTTLDFYTRFSRPTNALYSWNRSFNSDRASFLAGDLALYFGYASEGRELERANPNLRFDIAEIPQGASADVKRTYGEFYALSLMRQSDNPSGALNLMRELGSTNNTQALSTRLGMVPAHRQLVAGGSNDTYGRVAYSVAPVTYGWLNPNRAATDQIFNTMIRDYNENRRSLNEAVADALSRLSQEY